MELVKQLRKRLPQAGGTNLWQLVKRLLRILRLPPVGRDAFARIVREYGLKVRRARSFNRKTTYSNHSYAVQPNRYKDFELTGPNQVFVADITYVPVESAHGYLFLITDAYSRYIVGYELSSSLSHQGAIKALEMARDKLTELEDILHHSDRGVQYCCHSFLDHIFKYGMTASMTESDHCAENALAERVNGILKQELIFYHPYSSMKVARNSVRDAIFAYNHLRTHGSLGGKTPAEVHFGQDTTLELWANELISFQMPTHPHRSNV